MKLLLVSRGIPSEDYPHLGIFEWDQAKALNGIGIDVIYTSLDFRSILKWRKWGTFKYVKDGIKVYSLSYPIGGIFKSLYYNLGKFILANIYKKILNDEGKVDLAHAHFTEIGAISSVLKYKFNVPLITTEHSSNINKSKLSKRTTYFANIAYNSSDCIISVSNSLSKKINKHFDKESIVVPNILDTSNIKYSPIKHDVFTFTSIGSLLENKGFYNLIQAFVVFKNQNVKLRIIGDGPLKHFLEKEIKSLELDNNVFLEGYKSRKEISSILNSSDAFVLASRSETFGVVYIEAMLAGLPIIGTYCGGPEDFINEVNGLLVPIDDIIALSDAMLYMKNHRYKYDSREISRKCLEDFSPSTIAKSLNNIYKNFI